MPMKFFFGSTSSHCVTDTSRRMLRLISALVPGVTGLSTLKWDSWCSAQFLLLITVILFWSVENMLTRCTNTSSTSSSSHCTIQKPGGSWIFRSSHFLNQIIRSQPVLIVVCFTVKQPLTSIHLTVRVTYQLPSIIVFCSHWWRWIILDAKWSSSAFLQIHASQIIWNKKQNKQKPVIINVTELHFFNTICPVAWLIFPGPLTTVWKNIFICIIIYVPVTKVGYM